MDEVVRSEDRVAALEQQLVAVLQRLDVLETENRALRSAQAAPATAPGPGAEHADNGVTRRRLLVGSVGAAAVGAVAMVGNASPAADGRVFGCARQRGPPAVELDDAPLVLLVAQSQAVAEVVLHRGKPLLSAPRGRRAG